MGVLEIMAMYTGPVVARGDKWLFYNEEKDAEQRVTTASKNDSDKSKAAHEIDLTSRADHYLDIDGELEDGSLEWLCSANIVQDTATREIFPKDITLRTKSQSSPTESSNLAAAYVDRVKELTARPVTVSATADNTRGINPVQFVFVALWEGATLVAPLFAVAPNDTIYPGQSKTVPLAPNEWEVTAYQYFWHENYGGDWHVVQGPKWTAQAGYFYKDAGIVWTPPRAVAGALPLNSTVHSFSIQEKKKR